MFGRLSKWWYGSSTKPAATSSPEKKPEAPAHTSTHSIVAAAAAAKKAAPKPSPKPVPKPAPQHDTTPVNNPVITPAPDASPTFSGETKTLVAQHIDALVAIQTAAKESQVQWEGIKVALGQQGAQEEVSEEEINHGEDVKGFFAKLWTIVKENCEAAESFMKDKLHGVLGQHISDLHQKIRNKLDALQAETDAQKQLQLKLSMCNLIIDIDIERQVFAKQVQEELESCLRDAQYAELLINYGVAALIKVITTLPIPTPDFGLAKEYEAGLSERVKQEVVEEDQFEAGLQGTLAEAFVVVGGDVQSPQPEAKTPERKLSATQVSGSPLYAKPAAAGAIHARTASVEHKGSAQDVDAPRPSPLRKSG